MSTSDDAATWWRQAVFYQVYPRGFADSDGDGTGDLSGVASRIPYLAELGVDALWLSPFYPSALADGGYDVDDHRDVDPTLGSLDAFDDLVTTAHGAGLRVVVDIVPNHTSDRHAWFVEALAAGPGSRARQRYLFRDGTGPDGSLPPNDWQGEFGGPLWSRVDDGQWYLHSFSPHQPDLNWDHADVRDDFVRTLRFWADRGVDGFRVDVAHGLVKDLSEPYAPWSQIADYRSFTDGSNPLWDRDGVHDVYASWRAVFDEYDPPRFAVAEAHSHPARRPRYASPAGLGQSFNFEIQDADWDAGDLRRIIDSSLAQAQESGSTTTWHLGNHDVPRVATRYGLATTSGRSAIDTARAWLRADGREPALDRALGGRRARAAVMLLLALPGSTYVYQGEELGLHEVGDLAPDDVTDPWAATSGEKGRDGCRVPLPWTADGPSLGFGTGPARPRQPAWFASYAASVQDGDPGSTLALYRSALALRSSLLSGESMTWVDAPADVLHLRRSERWHAVTNLAHRPVPLPVGAVLLTSAPLVGGLLPVDTTAWVDVGR